MDDLREGRRISFDGFDVSPGFARREGLVVVLLLQAFACGIRDDDDDVDP